MNIDGTVLIWGNSLGIRLKKSDMQKMGIGAKQKVKLQIVGVQNPLTELYGFGKRENMKITAQDIRRNRRELEGKWDG